MASAHSTKGGTMPAKRRFRSRPSIHRAPSTARPPRRYRRIVLVALATATAPLGLGATTSLAATGSAYYDGNGNVGAGHIFFNATFTGAANLEPGPKALPSR